MEWVNYNEIIVGQRGNVKVGVGSRCGQGGHIKNTEIRCQMSELQGVAYGDDFKNNE